ncbi:MAG: hypothetical protein GF400_01725, partial [Candidatus Eisenbacteria bacterium]|nr:hypothetical protein [Candidatus Eisenbacteria bacterium]
MGLERATVSFTVHATSGGAEKTKWKVLSVDHQANGRHSVATVAIPEEEVQQWDTEIEPDDLIAIKRDTTVIFKGRLLNPTIDWSGSFEEISGTLYGPEWELERAHVEGIHALVSGGGHEQLTGVPCIFNPDGVGNKEKDELEFNNDLTADSTEREKWDVESVIKYLVDRFGADVASGIVSYGSTVFPTGADTFYLPHVDVNRRTYREAFSELMERAGYAWKLEPANSLDAQHNLVIQVRGDSTGGTKRKLYLPASGTAGS